MLCVISKSKAREIIATQDKDIQHSNSFTDFRQFFYQPHKIRRMNKFYGVQKTDGNRAQVWETDIKNFAIFSQLIDVSQKGLVFLPRDAL